MPARLMQLCSAFFFAVAVTVSSPALAGNDGVIAVKSAFPIGETIERLKKDRPTKASSPSARSTNPSWQRMRTSRSDHRYC